MGDRFSLDARGRWLRDPVTPGQDHRLAQRNGIILDLTLEERQAILALADTDALKQAYVARPEVAQLVLNTDGTAAGFLNPATGTLLPLSGGTAIGDYSLGNTKLAKMPGLTVKGNLGNAANDAADISVEDLPLSTAALNANASLGSGITVAIGAASAAASAAADANVGLAGKLAADGGARNAGTDTGVVMKQGAETFVYIDLASGLVIDITKPCKRAVTANVVLAFSAAFPVGREARLLLTNGTATDWLVTIPGSYSMALGATITNFTLKAGDERSLAWRKPSARLNLYGEQDAISAAGVLPSAVKALRAAATANVGAISTGLNPGSTVDGVTVDDGDLVLLAFQATQSQNGIYRVSASPGRASQFDEWLELYGAVVDIVEGAANAGTRWRCTSPKTGTIGTTAVTWAQVMASVNVDGQPALTAAPARNANMLLSVAGAPKRDSAGGISDWIRSTPRGLSYDGAVDAATGAFTGTDETAIVQAHINLLIAVGGGICRIPEGKWKIGPLLGHPTVSIVGAGRNLTRIFVPDNVQALSYSRRSAPGAGTTGTVQAASARAWLVIPPVAPFTTAPVAKSQATSAYMPEVRDLAIVGNKLGQTSDGGTTYNTVLGIYCPAGYEDTNYNYVAGDLSGAGDSKAYSAVKLTNVEIFECSGTGVVAMPDRQRFSAHHSRSLSNGVTKNVSGVPTVMTTAAGWDIRGNDGQIGAECGAGGCTDSNIQFNGPSGASVLQMNVWDMNESVPGTAPPYNGVSFKNVNGGEFIGSVLNSSFIASAPTATTNRRKGIVVLGIDSRPADELFPGSATSGDKLGLPNGSPADADNAVFRFQHYRHCIAQGNACSTDKNSNGFKYHYSAINAAGVSAMGHIATTEPGYRSHGGATPFYSEDTSQISYSWHDPYTGLLHFGIQGNPTTGKAGIVFDRQIALQTQWPANMTTGGSTTVGDDTDFIRLNAGAVIASYGVGMPANPIDGHKLTIAFDQAVTAVTHVGNTGQTLLGGLTRAWAGLRVSYIYRASNTTWEPTTLSDVLQTPPEQLQAAPATATVASGVVPIWAALSANVAVPGSGGNITAADNPPSGVFMKQGSFAGAWTLVHSAAFVLPNNGQNIVTAAGDTFTAAYVPGTGTKITSYTRANGLPISPAANAGTVVYSGNLAGVPSVGTVSQGALGYITEAGLKPFFIRAGMDSAATPAAAWIYHGEQILGSQMGTLSSPIATLTLSGTSGTLANLPGLPANLMAVIGSRLEAELYVTRGSTAAGTATVGLTFGGSNAFYVQTVSASATRQAVVAGSITARSSSAQTATGAHTPNGQANSQLQELSVAAASPVALAVVVSSGTSGDIWNLVGYVLKIK